WVVRLACAGYCDDKRRDTTHASTRKTRFPQDGTLLTLCSSDPAYAGQQLRYALGLLRYRESHFQLSALEHLHQQKADGMKRLTTARCRELSLASQVLQVTTDLILIKPVRRLAIVLGQALNRLQIGLVNSRGKATH